MNHLKIFEEFASNIKKSIKPNGYWTKERCQEESLKYDYRGEFLKKSAVAYGVARKNGWLNEICSHMIRIKNINGYWTKKLCHEESLKYKTKNEFRKNNNAAYIASKRNGWFNDICSHMISPYKSKEYWTKEKCHEEALKYKTRFDFSKKSSGAYISSRINGWYEEICTHMNQFRNNYMGYVYEFDDNHFYVGITSRERKRIKSHSKDEISAVFKYIKLSGLVPVRKVLFAPTSPKEASELEKWWVKDYVKRGWKKLNVAHAGSLGGTIIKWTKEKCREEALKYNTMSEFLIGSPGACGSVRKNGWLDNVCSHMISPIKPMGYWTKEKCQKEALKYKYRSEFRGSAYNVARKNGWLDEICYHMTLLQKPNKYWNKERCQEEASKYKTKSEFRKNQGSAYASSYVNDWLDEICSHMTSTHKPDGYWTYNKCREIASKYKSRFELQKNDNGCYRALIRNGWLDKICSHMISPIKPMGYWTKEKCQKEALKYKYRSEFQKNSSSAYIISRKNGWIDDICSHMTLQIKPNGHWNKKNCKEESLKYKTRTEFNDECSSAYNVSRKNGWLDEFFPKNK